jgi:hypothetical protein
VRQLELSVTKVPAQPRQLGENYSSVGRFEDVFRYIVIITSEFHDL